jgi:hypothetical protein
MKPSQPTFSTLAHSRVGRVLLHAWCAFRHPGHLMWHWDGILREFKEL